MISSGLVTVRTFSIIWINIISYSFNLQIRLTALVMCGLMANLVISKFRKCMVIHDIECPYWDQVSLNNTKPINSHINPDQTGCHWRATSLQCLFFSNLYSSDSIVHVLWKINRNLSSKILTKSTIHYSLYQGSLQRLLNKDYYLHH